MIDPTKIFGLFDNGLNGMDADEVGLAMVNIKDTPEYKLGMFARIVMDHLNFNQKVIDFFLKSNDELEREDIQLAGEFVVYNRAWFYIKDVNLKEKKDWYALEKLANPKLQTALDLAIHFFEEKEEYEKCAHLHKLSQASENFLN